MTVVGNSICSFLTNAELHRHAHRSMLQRAAFDAAGYCTATTAASTFTAVLVCDYVSRKSHFCCVYSKFYVSAASCQGFQIVTSSSQCSVAHPSPHTTRLITRVFPHPPFVSRVTSSRLSQPLPSSITPVKSSNNVEMTHRQPAIDHHHPASQPDHNVLASHVHVLRKPRQLVVCWSLKYCRRRLR